MTMVMASEMMILHGNYLSPNAMRSLAVLYEKKLDFKFVDIDMLEEEQHKKEPFISLNPFGQVPAFEHGDFKLFESRAITSYISHTFPNSGTQLVFPDDHKKRTITTMWMEVESHQFNRPTTVLGWELGFKPLIGMDPNEAKVKEHEAKLCKILDVYEARLSKSKYLGGDEYSLVDLHHIPNIWFLISTPAMELFISRPHVHAWCQDIMGRPAWLQIDAHSQKEKQKILAYLKMKFDGMSPKEVEEYKEELRIAGDKQ